MPIPDELRQKWTEAANEMMEYVHEWSKLKGWWEQERNDGELLMLAVTELAEACEGLRHGNPQDDKIEGFTAAETELADCIIRLFDMARARGWRVAEALCVKMDYNETREHRHGGKRF